MIAVTRRRGADPCAYPPLMLEGCAEPVVSDDVEPSPIEPRHERGVCAYQIPD